MRLISLRLRPWGRFSQMRSASRVDLSANAKLMCSQLDKFRNGNPRSERYLQCNPSHYTLAAACGFKSRSQVTRAIQELVQAGLVTVQHGQLALYVLAWPPRPMSSAGPGEALQPAAAEVSAADEPKTFHQQLLREAAEVWEKRPDAEMAAEEARARSAASRLQDPTWSKLARQREKALLVEREKATLAEIEAEESQRSLDELRMRARETEKRWNR